MIFGCVPDGSGTIDGTELVTLAQPQVISVGMASYDNPASQNDIWRGVGETHPVERRDS